MVSCASWGRVMTLSERIRQMRLSAGLTQAAAATRAGMTQPTWALLESGRRDPRISSLRRIAKALDVSVAKLLDGVDS